MSAWFFWGPPPVASLDLKPGGLTRLATMRCIDDFLYIIQQLRNGRVIKLLRVKIWKMTVMERRSWPAGFSRFQWSERFGTFLKCSNLHCCWSLFRAMRRNSVIFFHIVDTTAKSHTCQSLIFWRSRWCRGRRSSSIRKNNSDSWNFPLFLSLRRNKKWLQL